MIMNIALIPARAGSARVPGKNTRLLAGHPLLAYRIAAAKQSGCFRRIVVSTEDPLTAEIAQRYGASVLDRPAAFASAQSPDIEWVNHALRTLQPVEEAFAILRPTSPFVSGQLIRQGLAHFLACQPADSLRMIRRVREHPSKMWMVQRPNTRMVPLHPYWTRTGRRDSDAPEHSSPTQCLVVVYLQTGGLEWAWVKTVYECESIAGNTVIPFEVNDELDINTEADWEAAERAVAAGSALPDAGALLSVGNHGA